MVYNQFEHSSVVMVCLRIMILLSKRRLLRVQHKDDEDEGLSSTYKSKHEQFSSFGWILRFTETRDARVRVMTWDVLTELFDF